MAQTSVLLSYARPCMQTVLRHSNAGMGMASVKQLACLRMASIKQPACLQVYQDPTQQLLGAASAPSLHSWQLTLGVPASALGRKMCGILPGSIWFALLADAAPCLQDLRGHVVRRADHGARKVLLLAQRLGDAKVAQLDDAMATAEDVIGFQVPMDDTLQETRSRSAPQMSDKASVGDMLTCNVRAQACTAVTHAALCRPWETPSAPGI